MRLSFEEIQSEIKRVFVKYGMTEEKADICARIHTESTYDGIYSHGTNRVARFVDYIQRGWVDINADPTIEKDLGAVKVINGNNSIPLVVLDENGHVTTHRNLPIHAATPQDSVS